jgi:hypothetical protein
MKLRWLGAIVALAFLAVGLVLVSSPALAQTTGSVEGTVTDSSNASLPGASIELKSPQYGTRTTVSNADGRFRFSAVPPGVYTVASSLSGFKKVERTAIKVNLDSTATVPIKMEISVSQEIVVTGEAPVVDTTSNTAGLQIRQDVVQKLPLGRNYASAVEINPGVSLDNADTQGRALAFSIYGATSIENQYLVDGVNTTNVIRGFQGKALTQEFIEEVQVKAGGYEAEYGRAMGGIINVVTKSGGNEFHGDAFGYFDRKGWIADERIDTTTDINQIATSKRNREDFGADLGGYALKDRVWFFAAYNRINQNVDQVPLAGTGLPNAGKNFPISFHTDLFSGKLTARPTDSTTIVGTIFGDPEIRNGTLRNFTASDPTIQIGERKVGATDWSAGLTQLFGTIGLANVRYSQHKDRYEVGGPGVANTQIVDRASIVGRSIVSNGFGRISGFRELNHSERKAVKADGTLFVSTHEIKGGIDYEDNLTTSTDIYSGGARLQIRRCTVGICGHANGATDVYYEHDFFSRVYDAPNGQANLLPSGFAVEPHAYRLGFFLQDSYKVMPNLTVNAGLRYDQEDIRKFDGTEIFNQQVVDGSGKVIQQGNSPFKLKNEWQPRIGIAWDPMKDGSTKVSASFGRFYYALPTDLTVRSYGAKFDVTTYNFDSNPLHANQSATIGRQSSAQGGFQPEPFQDNLKGYYQDEFALGFDKAIDPTFSVGVRYTYRNLGRAIEDRCDFDYGYPEANGNTCVIINPGSDSPFATGIGVHTCTGSELLGPPTDPQSLCTGPQTTNTAVPAAERKFHGVELVVKKRVSNQLWLQASYLWSHLYGNYDGAANIGIGDAPGTGQTDPGINEDYDYPQFLKYAAGNLTLDRRHSFRLDTSYSAPFGLQVGLQTYLRQGLPRSKFGFFNSLYGEGENFATPRGSEGRNPWEFEVNLSLGYAIKFSNLTVTLFAQGFNLLDRQTTRATDQACTIDTPSDGQVSSITNCNDPTGGNPDFGKTAWRSNPRQLRLGARVSF